jgi:L-fuconate dehydratase
VTDRFIALDVHDVRFPTSDNLDGSDAMNPNPDYSAAYAVLRTDAGDGLEGHALAFTTGPGNHLQIRAIEGLADWVVGRRVEDLLGDLGAFARELVHEPHLRWLGPRRASSTWLPVR